MRLAALTAALLVTLSGEALARPSLWQRARDPATARAELVAREIERYLGTPSDGDRADLGRDLALAAVAVGNLAHAEELPGTRVQCLFGIALTEAGLYRRAHNVLKRVLAQAPEGPLAARCYYEASIAAAHLGYVEFELETLTRTIELDFGQQQLANAYCNRAEAWMRKGDLARAVADYEKGLRLASNTQQALCYYGLAVAHDRNGDTPSALQALGYALIANADALDLPSVFFVPNYEIHYYKALSRMAAARQLGDDDEDERLEQYERALRHWEAYLAGGEQTADPWLTQARLHAATCRRELEASEKPKSKGKAKRKPRRFAEPPAL